MYLQKNNSTIFSSAVSLIVLLLFFAAPTAVKAQFGNNPCMGASTTRFNLATSTLVSGTAGTIGVKYKFANAYVATPASNSIDVIAELVNLQYGTVYDATKFSVTYDQQGNPPNTTTGFGVDGNFQPAFIGSTTSISNPAGTNENLSQTWKFSFVLNTNNAVPVY